MARRRGLDLFLEEDVECGEGLFQLGSGDRHAVAVAAGLLSWFLLPALAAEALLSDLEVVCHAAHILVRCGQLGTQRRDQLLGLQGAGVGDNEARPVVEGDGHEESDDHGAGDIHPDLRRAEEHEFPMGIWWWMLRVFFSLTREEEEEEEARESVGGFCFSEEGEEVGARSRGREARAV